MLALVCAVALTTAWRNGRRFTAAATSVSPSRALVGWARIACIGCSPATRAGFSLAAAALTRSGPHRSVLAVGVACAVAWTAANVGDMTWNRVGAVSEVSLTWIALEPAVLIILALAVYQAVKLPADRRGATGVVLAWSGSGRHFRDGVRRAGLLMTAGPMAVLAWPAHYRVMGTLFSLVHGGIALLASDILLRFLLRRHAAVPLVTAAEGESHMKTHAPIYAIGGLAGLWGFAWLERLALSDTMWTAGFVGLLVCLDFLAAVLPTPRVALASTEPATNHHDAVQLALTE